MLTISLDAVGFSLNEELSSTTLNKLRPRNNRLPRRVMLKQQRLRIRILRSRFLLCISHDRLQYGLCKQLDLHAKINAVGYRCEAKRASGGACSRNNAYASGFCVGSFFFECPAIHTLPGRPSGMFSTQQASLASLVESARHAPATMIVHPAICVCVFSSECPTIYSSTGCRTHQLCTQKVNAVGYRCQNKRTNGSTCITGNAYVGRHFRWAWKYMYVV
jgi:hypothetical protein